EGVRVLPLARSFLITFVIGEPIDCPGRELSVRFDTRGGAGLSCLLLKSDFGPLHAVVNGGRRHRPPPERLLPVREYRPEGLDDRCKWRRYKEYVAGACRQARSPSTRRPSIPTHALHSRFCALCLDASETNHCHRQP